MTSKVPGAAGLAIPRNRVFDGLSYRLTGVFDDLDQVEAEKALRRTMGARVRVKIIRIRGSGYEERYAVYVH